MTAITPDTAPTPSTKDIEGRSLWADARRRLLRNRAAVTSLIILGLIAIACIIGPWLTQHGYEQNYRSFVKVPASLEPYPRASDIQPSIERILRRTGVEIGSVEKAGGIAEITLVSEEPINERLLRGFERSRDFENPRVIDRTGDGRQITVAVDVAELYFFFGTDSNGRDLLTRTLIGGRISLMIGLAATFVSLLIGVTYGATAGFLGGKADHIMMRAVDILYSLPFMFFVILLMVFFGRNVFLMFIALGAVEWLDMARIVRGQTISLKRREFIEAARACGVSNATTIRRHIIPNTLGPVVVFMTLTVPKVILIESFLSFLGLGVQEPMTSWGVLIADGANNMEGATWMLVFPATFLAVTLFCLNFIGDGLRDALDPKDR